MEKYTGKNLAFIVGCPRSGTTWLQKLLASHPKVHTGEESHVFSQFLGPQVRFWNSLKVDRGEFGAKHAVGPPAYFRDEEFLAILQTFLVTLLRPMIDKLKPDEVFIEKTPSHALYISEIRQLLPESRIINIVRDPRAVVASLLASAKTWGADWAPSDPRVAAAMWVQHVQAVRKSASKLSKSDFYEVRYETLWQDPKLALKNLTEFLELTWSEESIGEAINRNRPEAIETDGTPIPVYGEIGNRLGTVARLPQDFVRKAGIDSWRRDLNFASKRAVWKIVHNTMKDTGYYWRLSDWL